MLNMMNHGILGGLIWWVESTENRGFYQWKKKGFLVNLHLPFIQFWLGIRARYLKSILLVKP